ncbi:hypothetical protein SALBM311S_01977 [Streptomyces alboniger]
MYASSPVTASTAPIAALEEPEATAIGTPAACRSSTKARICPNAWVDARQLQVERVLPGEQLVDRVIDPVLGPQGGVGSAGCRSR